MVETKNQIMEGDCLDVLSSIPRRSVALVLTDPPYLGTTTATRGYGKKKRWSDFSILSGWWKAVVAAIAPTLKSDSVFAVFVNANALAVFWPTMYETFGKVQLGVWNKLSIAAGFPVRNQSEFIIFASNGKPWRGDTSFPSVLDGKRIPPKQRNHPSQKPDFLIQRILLAFCPPDGIVLDPFAGSGSVHKIAVEFKRSSISIEIDPSVLKIPDSTQSLMNVNWHTPNSVV